MRSARAIATRTAIATTVFTGVLLSAPASAIIPVIDGVNLTQNIMTAIEAVAHTAKQIEQYRTQLQQYENMLRNTAAPAAYIWDDAQATMDNLRQATDTLAYYKRQLGSIESYTAKFQDANFYRSSPCFATTGCTPAEFEAMQANERLASEAQKKANDAMFAGLARQQDGITADARRLQLLQSNAQSASGQMQALQNASMLASQQANQLLQIRSLLVVQHTMMATQAQATADREAKENAAAQAIQKAGAFKKSPVVVW